MLRKLFETLPQLMENHPDCGVPRLAPLFGRDAVTIGNAMAIALAAFNQPEVAQVAMFGKQEQETVSTVARGNHVAYDMNPRLNRKARALNT
jgi:hypothetical protein